MAEESKFRAAVKWAYLMNWGEQGFTAIFSFVLAYMLGPRDFGIIAMAMVYILFTHTFLEQGLVAALIQRKDLRKEHVDSVFWMDMAMSAVLMTLSIALSPWWAAANHTPQLSPIISVLSFGIPMEGLAIVQRAMLSRNMDFRSLSIRSNVSVVAGGALGMVMAVRGCGVWSLVGQRLGQDAVAVALLWKLSDWRPKFEFSLHALRDLWSFSVANLVSKIGVFMNQQAEALLIGLFFGPVAVGLYRMADKLKSLVTTAATSSLQSVSLPEFSRHQDRPAALKQSMLNCVRLSSVVSLPALAGLGAVSTLLMAMLGPKWMIAADALKVLSVAGMLMAFLAFAGSLLQAINRPHMAAMMVWSNAIVSVLSLLASGLLLRHAGVHTQVVGVAVARLASFFVFFVPFFFYVITRFCGISLRELFRTVLPSLVTAVVAAAVPYAILASGVLSGLRPVMALAIVVIIGGSAATCTLFKLDAQLREIALTYLRRALKLIGRKKRTTGAAAATAGTRS